MILCIYQKKRSSIIIFHYDFCFLLILTWTLLSLFDLTRLRRPLIINFYYLILRSISYMRSVCIASLCWFRFSRSMISAKFAFNVRTCFFKYWIWMSCYISWFLSCFTLIFIYFSFFRNRREFFIRTSRISSFLSSRLSTPTSLRLS